MHIMSIIGMIANSISFVGLNNLSIQLGSWCRCFGPPSCICNDWMGVRHYCNHCACHYEVRHFYIILKKLYLKKIVQKCFIPKS